MNRTIIFDKRTKSRKKLTIECKKNTIFVVNRKIVINRHSNFAVNVFKVLEPYAEELAPTVLRRRKLCGEVKLKKHPAYE